MSGANAVVSSADGFHYSYQKHSYVSRSRYELQLIRYRQFFPKHQLHVLRSEDLFAHTDACWDGLLRFISVAPMPLPASLPHSNSGKGEAASVPLSLRRDLRQQLAATYQVGRAGIRHHLARALTGSPRTRISNGTVSVAQWLMPCSQRPSSPQQSP